MRPFGYGAGAACGARVAMPGIHKRENPQNRQHPLHRIANDALPELRSAQQILSFAKQFLAGLHAAKQNPRLDARHHAAGQQFAQASAFSVVLILIVFAASVLISLMFRLAYPRYSR